MRNDIIVYVADDHTFVRKGMIRLLNTFERVKEIREAANGKELLSLIDDSEPDAVIIDLEMPVMNGFDTARYLIDHHPGIKILVLTMHTEELLITNLIDLGVQGFVNKSAEPTEVERALYSVIDNDFYRNEIVSRAIRNHVKRTSSKGIEKLTTRELEILILICKELKPADISNRLHISEKTFFNHRANILAKTGARSNVGLLKYAYINHILELPN